MKLTYRQLDEAAYIFEKANGYSYSEFENNVISKSKLRGLNTTELENIIVDGLNSDIYKVQSERYSAYRSLQKIGNHKLIANFQIWLKSELKNKQKYTIFPILMALDSLGEQVFNKKRTGQAPDEAKLNTRDAKVYLHNNSYNNKNLQKTVNSERNLLVGV